MKYTLNDKFILKNIECQVVYINNEFAWLAPIYENEVYHGELLNPISAFTRIGPKGIDSKGDSVRAISKIKSDTLT